MRREILAALFFYMAASTAALAQSSTAPAQMGITPATVPEVLQVLDNTKTWVNIGSVNSATHTFLGRAGVNETDIVVTDPSIGMKANDGTDNSPFVAALMQAQSPATGGYNITIPGIPGQTNTVYYFTKPFVNTRNNYIHCSGTSGGGVQLIFAPGVDGFIQDDHTNNADNSSGLGIFSGCAVYSLGKGNATVNTGSPAILTGVGFIGYAATTGIPAQTWHVGDGILLTPAANLYEPTSAIIPTPIGTTITNVAPGTGDLTLSNPVNSTVGLSQYGTSPHATVTFTRTGANNFSLGDAIQVGPNTYTFDTLANVASGFYPLHVVLGANFDASANNLLAAIAGLGGQYSVFTPNTSGEGAFVGDLSVKASYTSPVITFTSLYNGLNTNSFPAIYTPATGTSAGAFSAATFSGAVAQNVGMAFFQLPATQEYKIVTSTAVGTVSGYISGTTLTMVSSTGTVAIGQPIWSDQNVKGGTVITGGSGSSWTVNISQTVGSSANPVGMYAGGNIAAIMSGPQPLASGDVIWSDAFRFGSTVSFLTTQGGFPQSVYMSDAANTASRIVPTVTHPPGAEGNLWILPTGNVRRVASTTKDTAFYGWAIGQSMSCGGGGLNCDAARDEYNSHLVSFVGRWVAGDNTATASSINEEFSGSYLMDVWEGGTLGENYFNLNTESPEAGTAKWGIVQNCANQNFTTIFGGYISNTPGCTTDGYVYPPHWGGPTALGQVNYTGNLGAPYSVTNNFHNGLTITGGPSNQPNGPQCIALSGAPNINFIMEISNGSCGQSDTLFLGWDQVNKDWTWQLDTVNTGVMKFIDRAWASTTYAGTFGTGVNFPFGFTLGQFSQARELGSGPTVSTPSITGDMQIVTGATPGGAVLAFEAPNFTTTLNTSFTTSGPMTVSVAACPPIGLPFQTHIVDTTPAIPVRVGLLQSCSATSLIFNEIDAAGNAGDTLQFAPIYPAARMANDYSGLSWPVGTLTDVATLLAYAPCNSDSKIGLGVVFNGETAAAKGYNAIVTNVAGQVTRRLVFCDGTSWTYH